MPSLPWFRFDVAHERMMMDRMTDEQYGAHMRLRVHAWEAGSLPVSEDAVRGIGRWSKAAWARIWPVVSREWPTREDGLRTNQHLDTLRSRATAKSGAAKEAVDERWKRARSDTNVLQTKYESDTDVKRTNYHLRGRVEESREENTDQEQEREPFARDAREAPPLAPVPVGVFALDLSPGQLRAAAPGLVGAWNNIAAAHPPLTEIGPHYDTRKVSFALKNRPDIDWWAGVFEKVAASDFCRNRGRKPFVADFWWALTHADEILAGRYDNTEPVSANALALDEVLRDLA